VKKPGFWSRTASSCSATISRTPIPSWTYCRTASYLAAESYEENGNAYRVAGRIMSMRKFGKAAFFHIQDETGRLQIYAKQDLLGKEVVPTLQKMGRGRYCRRPWPTVQDQDRRTLHRGRIAWI
jgi:lysyl-tRNA synthetase class II